MTITKVNNADEGLKSYKLSEVALRNGVDSKEIWIVIKDSIYDVTKYVNIHPGGPELVTEYAGMDCTKEYQDAGHSYDANKVLRTLKIGELVEEDKRANRGKKIIASNGVYSDEKKKKKLRGFLFC